MTFLRKTKKTLGIYSNPLLFSLIPDATC